MFSTNMCDTWTNVLVGFMEQTKKKKEHELKVSNSFHVS